MVVARAKMQYEAKQELLHEKHLKAKGEAAEKRKKEAAQKVRTFLSGGHHSRLDENE